MTRLAIDLNVYRDETALLAGLQRGEDDACTCLFKQFSERLYRAVLRIVPDADEAETVVQSAFIKACDKFDTFAERSQLGTWLHRIAVNEALMQQRKMQGKAKLALDEQHPDIAAALSDTLSPAQTADPLAAAIGSELRAELERAIAALPDGTRQAWLLYELAGMRVKDIAAMLQISESATKVRLHRARQQMKASLQGYLHALAEDQSAD